MRKFSSVLAVSAALVLSLTSLSGAAVADTTGTAEPVTVKVAGQNLTMSPEMAAKVTSPAGWSSLTVKQLASVGITPGMGPHGAKATSTPRKGVVVRPNNASGCDSQSFQGSMCIYITGWSLQITSWSTSVAVNSYRCSFAAFWSAGSIVDTTNEVCGQNGNFWGDLGYQYRANPGLACNTWSGIDGRPCENITF